MLVELGHSRLDQDVGEHRGVSSGENQHGILARADANGNKRGGHQRASLRERRPTLSIRGLEDWWGNIKGLLAASIFGTTCRMWPTTIM